MKQLVSFCIGMVREKHDGSGKLSCTRVCAVLCCIAGCTAAIIGRDGVVVAALIGGGTVALLSRTKATAP